jgi:hypothetical protein
MGCREALPGSLGCHPQLPALRCLLSASPRSCRSSHAGPPLPLPHFFAALPSFPSCTSFLLHFTSHSPFFQPTIPSSTLESAIIIPPTTSKPSSPAYTSRGLAIHQRASPRPHHRHTIYSPRRRQSIIFSPLSHTPSSFGQLRFPSPAVPTPCLVISTLLLRHSSIALTRP